MSKPRKHQGSMNENSSVLIELSGADLSQEPKSSLSSFNNIRPGLAPSFASTSQSEVCNGGGEATLNLKTKIRKTCVRSQWTPELVFIPDDKIRDLICAATIGEDLVKHAWYNVDFVPLIVPNRRKLFAILASFGKSDIIIKIVEEGVDDGHLPFELDFDTGFLSYSVSGVNETHKIKALAPSRDSDSCWTPDDSDSFFAAQWKFLAPRFDMLCPCDDGCSTTGQAPQYEFKPQQILPFIKPNKEWKPFEQRGGFSMVKKKRSSREANYAVKSIDKGGEESLIKREIDNLKRFGGKQHRNRVVQLLCTFEYNNQYHLVFPWADGGNLRDLWQKHSPNVHNEPPSYDLAKWIAGEILGLAQGLHLIHHPGQSSTTNERTEGRHGDIKPENILWFRGEGGVRGTLKISDFGLTEYHSKASVSKVRADRISQTEMYRAPECEIPGGCVSQSYDMWSLGCVILQFMTWYAEGWEGVAAFSKRRSSASPPRKLRDEPVAKDMFYALAHPPRTNTAVKNQFDRLRHHERCSDMFVDMLDFTKARLLLIDKQRARSPELVNKFEEIYTRCGKDENYCILK